MIRDIIKLAEVVDYFTPKVIKNIKVDFKVKELNLRFKCDDKGMGDFRVFIYNSQNELIAYMEGKNKVKTSPKIGQNINKYSRDFLFNCFHMARCNREFERTDDINYSKGFDYFRKKAIKCFCK